MEHDRVHGWRIRRRWRRSLVLAGVAVLLGFLIPLAAHSYDRSVRFHQFEIAGLEARYGRLSPDEFLRTLRSAYGSGVQVLRGRRPGPPFHLDDSHGLFDYVFARVPPLAVVHPTERFYYFKTRLEGAELWGNLRVADLAKGRLMFSHFAPPISEGRVWTIELSGRDGLDVVTRSAQEFDVTWKGRTVRFYIADLGDLRPRRLALLEEEEFSGHVHDESGLKFFLLFNRDTRAFYYVLDEENGVAEQFQDLEDRIQYGRRTQFVFFKDPDAGRRILLGVSLANIEANNFFDGPGDQVPIGLDLREWIYAAYPSARLGEGIDPHGVFLGGSQWRRHVIGPFHPYRRLEEIVARVKSSDPTLPKGRYWTGLTREWWWTPPFVERTVATLRAEGKPTDLPLLNLNGGSP